jgi:hypothetical protein
MMPLDIGAIFPFQIWLTYHPDAARVPRVRRLIDWIVETSDPKAFPWLETNLFIHAICHTNIIALPWLTSLKVCLEIGANQLTLRGKEASLHKAINFEATIRSAKAFRANNASDQTMT